MDSPVRKPLTISDKYKLDIRKYAIIVAGGSGLRAGGDIPKQFQAICGRPMLWWSLKAFYDEDPSCRLIVVLHPGFFDDWDRLCSELMEEQIPHEVVCGGRTRAESVANGLMAIPIKENDGIVAVHDAARPLVTTGIIRRGWEKCMESGFGSVPVVPVTDSLRVCSGGKSQAVDRSLYVCVQTPQVFPLQSLRTAYRQADTLSVQFTDDASVVEASGFYVSLYDGSPENIKVTHPSDFTVAGLLLSERLS